MSIDDDRKFSLLENGCREYVFISQFFMAEGNDLSDLFHQILGKTEAHLKVNPCFEDDSKILCSKIFSESCGTLCYGDL